MKIFENDSIKLCSIGMFGSWCFHKPTKTLFDCGDGVSQTLGHKIFAVERIILGHSHIDHISGLLAFVGLRNGTMGANDKPLDVWCNMDDPFIVRHINFVRDVFPQSRLKFKLSFLNMQEGQIIPLGSKSYIKAFKTKHTRWSLGFCVYRESKRLADGVDKSTIGAQIKAGIVNKDDVTVRCDIKEFAYTLDNFSFDPSEIKDVKEVVLDCTFLNAVDRTTDSHASLEDCEHIILESSCKRAYLSHISPRYALTKGSTIVWDEKTGFSLGGHSILFESIKKDFI